MSRYNIVKEKILSGHIHRNNPCECADNCGTCDGARCDICKSMFKVYSVKEDRLIYYGSNEIKADQIYLEESSKDFLNNQDIIESKNLIVTEEQGNLNNYIRIEHNKRNYSTKETIMVFNVNTIPELLNSLNSEDKSIIFKYTIITKLDDSKYILLNEYRVEKQFLIDNIKKIWFNNLSHQIEIPENGKDMYQNIFRQFEILDIKFDTIDNLIDQYIDYRLQYIKDVLNDDSIEKSIIIMTILTTEKKGLIEAKEINKE